MAISIQTTQYNLIYIYSRKEILDAIKIGKASINEPESVRDTLTPNCTKLNEAAIECIKVQTQRAGANFTLLHTELAWFENTKGEGSKFMDTDVHDVLIHSGYKRKEFDSEVINPTEWFMVDLDTAIKAIAAIKNGQEVIEGPVVIEKPKRKIQFREEQENAIAQTIAHYDVGRKMLWNAKMRFGKTLCALELIHRKQYGRVLILTHRPAVRSGWFEDYHNLKFENQQYGSKAGDKFSFCDENDTKGKDFETLEKDFAEHGVHYIYFASMQDLRGSKTVSDKGINKNDDVFKTDWDLIILDEAHEGTETLLGKNVINGLCEKRAPYLLYLSGTPFNILYHFSDEEIYTWDYVMEQEAKKNWSVRYSDKPNPYEGLAQLNIYTYNLGDVFETNAYTRTEDDFFNFAEFFRIWTDNEKVDGAPLPASESKGKFVHEEHIRKFLDMLCDENSDSKYPYSTDAFRNALSHTLWMLPSVDAASALEKLIQEHRLSKELNFTTINVAGEGSKMEGLDEDDAKKIEKLGNDVLQKVKAVIKIRPRTITLSCGRLTTGVSVPEWTGVFMLRGGFNVDAGNYMQTIFRGQTPFKNGAIKTNCYAFDFAPDRTLTVIDDYVEKQPASSKTSRTKGERTASLLRLCPVIAMKGGQEIEYDAHSFISEVNRAYREHVLRNGFKGRMLHKSFTEFSEEDHALLAEIGKIFAGNKTKTTSDGQVKMSESGLTGEDNAKKNKDTRKKQQSLPKAKTQSKEEADQRKRSQNVLDQIFVRLPLLLFGAVEDTSHLSIAELIKDEVIDQPSWGVFMPENFTKSMLLQIAHLVKEDLLISCTAEIIKMAKRADELSVEERVREIARILSTFHYPDHETVLTPWRVVNIHMGDTIGGYNFYDENYRNLISGSRWVEKEDVTERVFKVNDTHILEINSKSGVYPLYLAYTLWRVNCERFQPNTEDEKLFVWDNVLNNNIFVLCQTEMAKKITERVLRGYRDVQKVIGECKAHRTPIDMTDWLKFIGKVSYAKKDNPHTIGIMVCLSGANGAVIGTYNERHNNDDTIQLITNSELLNLVSDCFKIESEVKVREKLVAISYNDIYEMNLLYYDKKIYWAIAFSDGKYTISYANGQPMDRDEFNKISPLMGNYSPYIPSDFISINEYVEVQQHLITINMILLTILVSGFSGNLKDVANQIQNMNTHENIDLCVLQTALTQNPFVLYDKDRDIIALKEEADIDFVDFYRYIIYYGYTVELITSEYYQNHINQKLIDRIMEIQFGIEIPEEKIEDCLFLIKHSPSALLFALTPNNIFHCCSYPFIKSQENMKNLYISSFVRMLLDGFLEDVEKQELSSMYFDLFKISEVKTSSTIEIKTNGECRMFESTKKLALAKLEGTNQAVICVSA